MLNIMEVNEPTKMLDKEKLAASNIKMGISSIE